jgi:putative endonuclease
MWTVYILKCSDDTFYVGCSGDIKDRLKRHSKGEVKYTSSRLPVQITHLSIFPNKYKAFEFETYLKSGSGRAFAKKRFI